MRFRSLAHWCFLLLAIVVVAGCERYDPAAFTAEVDEANYRRGKDLLRQGREQEALAAFLKVIERRGDDAPESHLEAGILYQQHIKDPIAAIYHYRKFRELKPNSPQADLVRQRVDAATREFARTLPAQPLENQMERLDLLDRFEALQRENAQLKEQLVAVRTNALAAPRPPAPEPMPGEWTGGPAIEPALQNEGLITRAPLEPETPVTVAPVPTTVTSRRTHVVVKGDTLYNLAQRYYGNQSKWRDIYAANRGSMQRENDLRIGMQLTIP